GAQSSQAGGVGERGVYSGNCLDPGRPGGAEGGSVAPVERGRGSQSRSGGKWELPFASSGSERRCPEYSGIGCRGGKTGTAGCGRPDAPGLRDRKSGV